MVIPCQLCSEPIQSRWGRELCAHCLQDKMPTEERMICDEIIKVPSGNPEPDCVEDMYTFVECGAPKAEGGNRCPRCMRSWERLIQER